MFVFFYRTYFLASVFFSISGPDAVYLISVRVFFLFLDTLLDAKFTSVTFPILRGSNAQFGVLCAVAAPVEWSGP